MAGQDDRSKLKFANGARVLLVNNSSFTGNHYGIVESTRPDGFVCVRWSNGVLGSGLDPYFLAHPPDAQMTKRKPKLKTLIKAYISMLRDSSEEMAHPHRGLYQLIADDLEGIVEDRSTDWIIGD